MTLVLSLELVKTYRVLFFRLSMRCVVFELAGGAHMCPPGRAKVAQTPGCARVKRQRSRKIKNVIFERNSFSMITSVFEMVEQCF